MFNNLSVYLIDLPILVVLISLVYSATRFDDWPSILLETGRWILRLLSFLIGIGVLLWFVTWI